MDVISPDGATQLSAAFVSRCSTLRAVESGECSVRVGMSRATLALLVALDDAGWGPDTPRHSDATPRLAAHEAVAAATRAALLRPDQGWDSAALAAVIDGANYVGHDALHDAVCACASADMASYTPAQLRARFGLPDDLTPETAAIARAALDAGEEMPPEAPCKAREAGAHPMASLAPDSLLVLCYYMTGDAFAAAAMTCDAWAHACARDNATRLRACAFMRDVYLRPAGGAPSTAREMMDRHERLASGVATAEDALWLQDAASSLVERGSHLAPAALSFCASALRDAANSKSWRLTYDECVERTLRAAEAAAAAAAAEAVAHVGGDVLARFTAAAERHAIAAAQLRLLAPVVRDAERLRDAMAEVCTRVLCAPMEAGVRAAAAQCHDTPEARAALAALDPAAALEPAEWLLQRAGGAAAVLRSRPVTLVLNARRGEPEKDDAEEAMQAGDAMAVVGMAEPAPPRRDVLRPLAEPERVAISAAVATRCDFVTQLAACVCAAGEGNNQGPLELVITGDMPRHILQERVERAAAEMEASPDGVWPNEAATAWATSMDIGTLFETILVVNKLRFRALLDLTCLTVANMIKGKSPEEIRRTFNIKNDFTPEEEEEVRRENAWAFE